MNRWIWALVVVPLLVSGARAADSMFVSTTAQAPWQAHLLPRFEKNEQKVRDIAVIPSKPFQEIEGFGGCFNELGWKALSGISTEKRDEVLKNLFGDDGCGFTMARMPIGSSDYGLSWYSLDDTPGDYSMSHFSIERDKGCLIPYIKAAMAYRPELKVWASPWSPPAWMKTNNHYAGGSLKEDPQTRDAYAKYLAMFVEAYRREGIDLYAVHVQNEPVAINGYPTCLWSGAQERDFIRDYLGPTFRQRKVPAQIWLGTINDENVLAYAGVVLSDPRAASYVTGVSYQWAGKDAIGDCALLYPEKRLMQSENECAAGNNNFDDAEHTFQLLLHYLSNGAGSYMFWNMVLDPSGKSSWGWKQNAMITADPSTGTVTYHPEFYVMKHFAHYVRPGAHRIAVVGAWQDKIAFANADGSCVLILANSSSKELHQRIEAPDGTSADFPLAAHSINTIVFQR